jgi:hypothetical protein
MTLDEIYIYTCSSEALFVSLTNNLTPKRVKFLIVTANSERNRVRTASKRHPHSDFR